MLANLTQTEVVIITSTSSDITTIDRVLSYVIFKFRLKLYSSKKETARSYWCKI